MYLGRRRWRRPLPSSSSTRRLPCAMCRSSMIEDRTKRGDQGFALVIVLGLTALLLPVAALLSVRAVTNLRLSANARAAAMAFSAAESGLDVALADLQLNPS